MRILVTGGTGYVGRHAVAALVAGGHDVRVLARNPEKARLALPPEAEIVVGQPLRSEDVVRALVGRDVLVQAAATFSYRRGDEQRMLVENPALARATFSAARSAAARVVDISSIVVFSVDSTRIDESSPLARPGGPAWDDPYLQSKVIAERLGRQMERDGLDRVTIYPGAAIGPEDRVPGTSGQVLCSLLRGDVYLRGRLPWVDVRDVAAAIVAALDAPTGSTHLITRGAESFREIAARLERLTERRVRPLFLPAPITRLLGRANDRLGGRLYPLPLAAQLEYSLRCPALIDGTRAEATLGVTYRDLDESLADAVRWWAANGVIEPRLAGRLAAAA